MVKLWMLSVLALLVVPSEGYRAPLYYGRRPSTFGVVDGVASTQHMPLVNSGGLLLEEDMGYNDRNNYAYYVPQDRYGMDRNLRYADGYDGRSGGRSGYIYGMNEPYARNYGYDNYYTSGRRYGNNRYGGGGYYNNDYYNNDYYGSSSRGRYRDYDNDYYGSGYSSSGYGPYNDGYRRGRRYNSYNNYNRNDGYGYGSSYNTRYALPSGSRD